MTQPVYSTQRNLREKKTHKRFPTFVLSEGARMEYFLLLFLPCVFTAQTQITLPGHGVIFKEPRRSSLRVLTTTGKECKFPFRQGGRIHHHCIISRSSRPWCSLTHNFDRDLKWGYCIPEKRQPNVFVHMSRRIIDPCQMNPCQNGGSCMLVPHRHSFECSCPESFTGTLCEHEKCYETIHLRYYDIGESWGRIHLRNVEQCTCVSGEIKCERVRYTMCRTNPCENDGTCRLITATGKEVCNCRRGYTGPYCSYEPETECYNGRGTGYRGVVGTTASGARCLPWNSDLLYDELHVGTVAASALRGLGEHAYCRNPDADKMPWCYTVNHGAISWEYCDVPSCVMPVFPLKSQIRVVLGQHNFNVTNSNTRTFGVEEYIFPKQFSVFNPTLHDIVLVKLKKEDGKCTRRSQFIRPICLPDKDMTFPDGYCCTISGWGHIHEKSKEYSTLQETGVRLIPHSTCTKPEVYGNHVTAGMICAGRRCADACQGDSGGPLACANNDVSFLYGIISWGEGCGRSGKPGVYTKVVNYIDWINSVIKRKPS